MPTLARTQMMKSTQERIKDLEIRLDRAIERIITLEEITDEKCECGGQSCGPTYKPTGSEK